MYQPRTYRTLMERGERPFFRVMVQETDLYVHARKPLESVTRDLVLQYRAQLETYLRSHPEFGRSLRPVSVRGPAPSIVREMAEAGSLAGVGPMAAVAGAVAEQVGGNLLKNHTPEVIVENGGDVFLKADTPSVIAVFAGRSPLSMKIGLRVDSNRYPMAVCTSSGSLGHSLSLGKGDAVCVVSRSCALADAAATALGNRLQSRSDIPEAIDFAKDIAGVIGCVLVMEDKVGMWGDIEVVPIRGKAPFSSPAGRNPKRTIRI